MGPFFKYFKQKDIRTIDLMQKQAKKTQLFSVKYKIDLNKKE